MSILRAVAPAGHLEPFTVQYAGWNTRKDRNGIVIWHQAFLHLSFQEDIQPY